jgi:hypothetical protein
LNEHRVKIDLPKREPVKEEAEAEMGDSVASSP